MSLICFSQLRRATSRQIRMKTESGELPHHIREMLSRQLKSNMYPPKKVKKTGRASVTRIDDDHPVKWLDIKQLKDDGLDATNLDRIVRHEDLQEALVKKKRKSDASKELKMTSRYAKQQEVDGKKLSMYEITQKTTNDGQTLLDSELKRGIPLDQLDSEDRVRLWGKTPEHFNSKDELDAESLAFVLSSSLSKTKKPWEKSDNPYDTTRLKDILENKIQLDKMQSRLSEIELENETKLGPEYNYLRLRGKHLFHSYLDRLAKLRSDIMEGLVEESRAEWDAFEKHETKRIQRIISNQVTKEDTTLLSSSIDSVPVIEATTPVVDISRESDVISNEDALVATKPKSKPKKKKKRLSPRERERRFKEKMEKKEVAEYTARLEKAGQDQAAQVAVEEMEEENNQPDYIWGTLPPGPEHLEYQSHVMGTSQFNGWGWKRPVYYVPKIPWREKVAEKTGVWPYHVDELELPHNWEENYEHFPYYQRQRMWEDPRYTNSVPSTEPDWPSKDHEFLDIYMSRSQFTHPANWRVRLGIDQPSKYTTLRGSIFEDKFHGSPYENPDFHKFMENPTLVCHFFFLILFFLFDK